MENINCTRCTEYSDCTIRERADWSDFHDFCSRWSTSSGEKIEDYYEEDKESIDDLYDRIEDLERDLDDKDDEISNLIDRIEDLKDELLEA